MRGSGCGGKKSLVWRNPRIGSRLTAWTRCTWTLPLPSVKPSSHLKMRASGPHDLQVPYSYRIHDYDSCHRNESIFLTCSTLVFLLNSVLWTFNNNLIFLNAPFLPFCFHSLLSPFSFWPLPFPAFSCASLICTFPLPLQVVSFKFSSSCPMSQFTVAFLVFVLVFELPLSFLHSCYLWFRAPFRFHYFTRLP